MPFTPPIELGALAARPAPRPSGPPKSGADFGAALFAADRRDPVAPVQTPVSRQVDSPAREPDRENSFSPQADDATQAAATPVEHGSVEESGPDQPQTKAEAAAGGEAGKPASDTSSESADQASKPDQEQGAEGPPAAAPSLEDLVLAGPAFPVGVDPNLAVAPGLIVSWLNAPTQTVGGTTETLSGEFPQALLTAPGIAVEGGAQAAGATAGLTSLPPATADAPDAAEFAAWLTSTPEGTAAQQSLRSTGAQRGSGEWQAMAQALGVTQLQTETSTPEGATPAQVSAGEPAAMMINWAQAAEAPAEAPVAEGSNTLAASLDEGPALETASPAMPQVDVALESETEQVVSTAAPEARPETVGLNAPSGDKALGDTTRTGAAPAAPQTPVRAEEVLPQILKQAELMKAQQQNTLKLQLYPEHLGKLEIKVVSHQGVLSAQLTADSTQVKGLLENQVVALQRSLQELGLKVDRVEVALNSAGLGGFDMGSSPFADQQQQQQGQRTASGGRQVNDYGTWNGNDETLAELVATPGDRAQGIDFVA
ncbi:MAG: flagellar hook-length control protein FliK [Candidatus Sericytochromatia bacterium]|nr:flagellar hook-length control protein FliK [Candidatus Sericytochromatia bacterium]